MALARERALVDHLTDQLKQALVGDLGPGTALGECDDDAAWVPERGRVAGVDRRARRVEDVAHPLARDVELHGYLGRFRGGIESPPFWAAAPSTPFSSVSSPTLRSASLSLRSSGCSGRALR